MIRRKRAITDLHALKHNLVAWWDLNNSTVDQTGNGYTLTSHANSAFALDPVFSSIYTARINASALSYLSNSAISLVGPWSVTAMWYAIDNGQSAEYPSVLALGDNGGNYLTEPIGDHTSSGGWIYSNAEAANYGQFNSAPLTSWNQSVITNDPAKGMCWYINGVKVFYNSGGGYNRNFTGIDLGASGGQAGNAYSEYNGYLKQCGVWNRVLNYSDIIKLNNNKKPLTFSQL